MTTYPSRRAASSGGGWPFGQACEPTAEGAALRFEEFRRRAFFPVWEAGLCLDDGDFEFVNGYRAIVREDERGKSQILSVVSNRYYLITNEQVCDLARRLFARVFGWSAADAMVPLTWKMPEGRASLHVDFTAHGLRFFEEDGGWYPFLRASNSYNKTCQVRFTVGVVRVVCANGMILRQVEVLQDLHTQSMEDWIRTIEEYRFSSEELEQFDTKHIRRGMERLRSIPVPECDFLAGIARALGLRPPPLLDEPQSRSGSTGDGAETHSRQRQHWADVAHCLNGLALAYRREYGDTAFSLLNAATEYASRTDLPGMHAGRIATLQFRCGRMLDEFDRPNARLRLSEADLTAASRLTAAAREWRRDLHL